MHKSSSVLLHKCALVYDVCTPYQANPATAPPAILSHGGDLKN